MSNEEVVECPKCKGTLDTGGECNDCEDVGLVCDSCYCELTGVIPVNHSYMRYPQVMH